VALLTGPFRAKCRLVKAAEKLPVRPDYGIDQKVFDSAKESPIHGTRWLPAKRIESRFPAGSSRSQRILSNRSKERRSDSTSSHRSNILTLLGRRGNSAFVTSIAREPTRESPTGSALD